VVVLRRVGIGSALDMQNICRSQRRTRRTAKSPVRHNHGSAPKDRMSSDSSSGEIQVLGARVASPLHKNIGGRVSSLSGEWLIPVRENRVERSRLLRSTELTP
jgi:hypothetical protein